ncbi:hypothetical protein IW262DRAFT_965044 [Armillaria fumosa]|nr:hypothetical protein IW262DRAFT_965044 [Armillaria fumosa]
MCAISVRSCLKYFRASCIYQRLLAGKTFSLVLTTPTLDAPQLSRFPMNFPTRFIIMLTTDRFSDLGRRHQQVTRLINRSSGLSSTSGTHVLSAMHQENEALTGARATSGLLTFSLALDPSIRTLISDSSRVCTHPGLKEYCRRESESASSGSRSDSLNVASKTRERTSICRRWSDVLLLFRTEKGIPQTQSKNLSFRIKLVFSG